MPTGYCTVADVRRALQETVREFDSGAWGADQNQVVVDAITAQTEWLEKTLSRHWYVPGGVAEDDRDLIPTSPNTRTDEESIQTGSGLVVDGSLPAPRQYQGSYTRIELARRDAEAITSLRVRRDGDYSDWVASNEFSGGTYPDALGEDYFLRVNNGGVSHLYIDTDQLYNEDDDQWRVDSWVNAVYVSFDYGHEGLPQTIRRAVAFRAGAELLTDDQASLAIPDDGALVSVETKKQALESRADELMEPYGLEVDE